MNQNKHNVIKFCFSILFLFVMSFSIILNNNSSGLMLNENKFGMENITDLEKTINSNVISKLNSEERKTISWDSFQNTLESSYTNSYSSWEFGPTPKFSLKYSNGTPIGLQDTIQTGPANEWVVDIEIPLEALAGANFGLAGFSLNYETPDDTYALSSIYGYSNIDVDVPEQQISINQGWFSLGIEQNLTDPNPSPPPPADVFIYNTPLRSFNFDSATNTWNFHIVGYLTTDILKGRWQFSLFVVDENLNSVSFGYNAYSSSNPPYRDFYVGVTADMEFRGFDGYKISLTDLNGNELDSALRGDPFLLNLNISSKTGFDYAVIELRLPDRYQQTLNTTDWYENITTINSGWIYNETLKSYQWTNGITGALSEQVFGTHEIQTEIYVDRFKDYNGYYDQEKLLLFAFSNGTILAKIGFRYYNNFLQRFEFYSRNLTTNLEDNLVNFNNGNYDFDVLNNSYSVSYNLTLDNALISGEYLYINSFVVDSIGNELYQTDYSFYQIGIETRVAKTRLFSLQGEVQQDTLRIKENETFRVVSVLQGITPDTDIQAVNLILNGYDYDYSDTSYRWSQVELFARYDYKKGTIEVGGYNSTQRQELVTGEYRDWVYSEKTGYHWEYNTTSGDYDWVDGSYYDWEYVTVYGDYWQYQYYDQQSLSWNEGWVPLRSPANSIGDNTSDLLNILARSVIISNGKLTFEMNISVTSNTPNLYYDFEVRFESFQFGEDFDSSYGPQLSTIWIKESVPSINVGGNDLFVDIVKFPLYLEYGNQKYLIKEEPYIQIDTSFEFLRTFVEYDFYSQTEREFLVNEYWSPDTGESTYYYTLLNGTKVFIQEGTGAKIFTLEFNTTGDLAYLNGTQIDSFQRYASYIDYYYDGNDWVNKYSFALVDGSSFEIVSTQEIQSDPWYHPITYEENFNITLFFLVNSTGFLLDNPHNYLNLYQYSNGVITKVSQVEVQDSWPQWDWRIGKYFVSDVITGERYYFYENSTWDYSYQYPCNYYCLSAEYLIDKGGITYIVGEGPWNIEHVFKTTQENFGTFSVPERYTRQIYFVKGSPNLLLPTVNLPAQSYWDLQNTVTEGGFVPSLKSVEINGEKITLRRLVNDWELQFTGNKSTIMVPIDSVKSDSSLLVINGQNFWNSSLTGYTIEYGKYSAQDGQLAEIQGSFKAKTQLSPEGLYEPYLMYKSVNYVLNATDASNIEIQNAPVGRIYAMVLNGSVIVNTTTDYPINYYWNGTHDIYVFQSIYGISLYSVNVGSYFTFQVYNYIGKFNYPIGDWIFDYNGSIVSYYTWIIDWNFEVWWGYEFVNINSIDYVITDQVYFADYVSTFTYGLLDGYSFINVGTFLGITEDISGFSYFYDYYDFLLNYTSMEEIRVNSTDIIVLWKVRLNGTAIVYTSNPWYYDYYGDYYQVDSYNGSIFYFLTLNDFEYLDEIHVYPKSGIYIFNGEILDLYNSYNIYLNTIEIDGQIVELAGNEKWTPIITVFYQGQDRVVNFKEEPVFRRISHYGYSYRNMYVSDWTIKTESSVWAVVVGNPRSNMWGYDIWTVNPDNGALDIDGDLTTTEDQYYVRRFWQSTNNYTEDHSQLNVHLFWDPNTTTFDNEYNLNSWMGFSTTTYTWDWSETYFWYYAENMTQINDNTLTKLQSTLLDGDEPAAGYWGVSWMLQNRTWADIVAEALANGWDWLASNSETYTWLEFGFSQSYFTYSNEGGNETWIFNDLTTSWSGLWLYKDLNFDGIADFNSEEITHSFIPTSVEQLVFTTPGIAFGDTSPSGTISLTSTDPDFNKTVDFGVQFLNVNGTTYPVIRDIFGGYGSYWDWHSIGIAGSDYNGFRNRPAEVNIDEIAFQLHFNIEELPGENNADVNLKLDQTIGNWKVDLTGGRKNLANYSLAISYFVELFSSTFYQLSDSDGQMVSNTLAVPSNSFTFGTGTGLKFAKALLEGEYVWAKNTSLTINSTSYTMPISQFQSFYQSEDGQSSVGFVITQEMYFLAIGFPKWDGFRVFQDPVYAAYAAVGGATTSQFAPKITENPAENNIQAEIGTVIQLSWVAQDSDGTTYEIIDENDIVKDSGPWLSGVPISGLITVESGTHTYYVVFYDSEGYFVKSGGITITGTQPEPTTTPPSSTGTGSASTTPTSPGSTSVITRTTEKLDTGIPGFTVEAVLILVSIISLVVIVRNIRRKK